MTAATSASPTKDGAAPSRPRHDPTAPATRPPRPHGDRRSASAATAVRDRRRHRALRGHSHDASRQRTGASPARARQSSGTRPQRSRSWQRAPCAGSSGAALADPGRRGAARPGAGEPARARVHRPHQRDQRTQPSGRRAPGCRACTTRTTRSSPSSTAPGSSCPSQIGRAVLPGKEPKTVRHRLNKLYEHGLVARCAIGIRQRTSADGRLPWLYTITRHGLETAKQRKPPAIHPQREWRPLEQRRAGTLPHNLHALSWAIELHRLVGDLATDYWRTPRYATGRYPVPQVGNGHKRHPITMARARGPRRPRRPRPPAVPRDQARHLARAADPEPQAHLRPARRARPHRPALLQPREVPRLRRVPHRLGARPPALPNARHPPRRRVRVPRRAHRARLRPRSRPRHDRADRRHGHAAARVVLRRPRPRLLRRRTRHPPRLARRARAPPASPRAAQQPDRQRPTRTRARSASASCRRRRDVQPTRAGESRERLTAWT